jgi:hypothetical protein
MPADARRRIAAGRRRAPQLIIINVDESILETPIVFTFQVITQRVNTNHVIIRVEMLVALHRRVLATAASNTLGCPRLPVFTSDLLSPTLGSSPSCRAVQPPKSR